MKKIFLIGMTLLTANAFADNPAHCIPANQLQSYALSHQINDIMTVKHEKDMRFNVWYTIVGLGDYEDQIAILSNSNNHWEAWNGSENTYGLMCGYRASTDSVNSEMLVFAQKYYKSPFSG